jgi:hypothetical protein
MAAGGSFDIKIRDEAKKHSRQCRVAFLLLEKSRLQYLLHLIRQYSTRKGHESDASKGWVTFIEASSLAPRGLVRHSPSISNRDPKNGFTALTCGEILEDDTMLKQTRICGRRSSKSAPILLTRIFKRGTTPSEKLLAEKAHQRNEKLTRSAQGFQPSRVVLLTYHHCAIVQ